MGSDGQSWFLDLNYDEWLPVSVPGPRPVARYKHGAVIVGENLYIAGGTRNGRYLSDIQAFDLRSRSWSSVKLNGETLPASSGHNMIKWENKLLLIGGHSRDVTETLSVRFIDLDSWDSGVIKTSGNIPVARGGQSVSLFGTKVIMFGGEDRHRRLLNDVHVLDLETMTWTSVEASQKSPAPRFDHTAALHANRYLLIFGGCSHTVFFNDLHVLDLESMEWSQPQLHGDVVGPRAGHAGVTVGESWYLIGGGDNKNGVPETLVCNMSKLLISVLTNVKALDPLASEGLSVSAADLDGQKFLFAFGGYNGKYNNEVFVMKPKPKDPVTPKIIQSPAAAAAAASVTAAYALSKSEKLDFRGTEDSNYKVVQMDNSQKDVEVELSAIREEKKSLETSVAEVKLENSAFKARIEEINGSFAELTKELHSVQGQLVAERSRCAKLEAQIGELQKMLESMQSIEEEVQSLRREKSALERDMEIPTGVKRQNSSGVWRWIAG